MGHEATRRGRRFATKRWHGAPWWAWVVLVEVLLVLVSTVVDVVLDGHVRAFASTYAVAVAVVGVVAARDATAHVVVERARARQAPWRLHSVVALQAALLPVLLSPVTVELASYHHDALDVVAAGLFGVLAVASASFVLAGLLAVLDSAQGRLNRLWAVLVTLLPLVGLGQYWYESVYKPSHQRPVVNIEATLDGVLIAPGKSRVSASVTLSNDGPTDVSFLDAVYTLTRFDVPASHLPTPRHPDGLLKVGRSAAQDPSGFDATLETGRLVLPGGHLAPGQHLQTSVVLGPAVVPTQKLRLTVSLSTLVGQEVGSAENCARTGPQLMCQDAAVETDGWVRRWLGDDPVVRTELRQPLGHPPVLRSALGESSGSINCVYPFFNARQFTTSVEWAPAPDTSGGDAAP